METFENVYLDLLKVPGRCRFAESGFAWKPSNGGETFTLDKDNINQAQWSKAARGHELKVFSRSSGITQLDGFESDAFDRLLKAFKLWYGVNLEQREHALRGWNWGKAEFGKSEVSFNVQNRPAFEVPYSEIINTNLAGRNEVAVDLQMAGSEANDTTINGHKDGAKRKGRKFGRARDQLVEARFYIPGTVLKKEKKEDAEDGEDGEVSPEEDEEGEEHNAANTWYETLVDKAEIGDVAGDTLASFIDVLHLTPRGRFDIDMYEKSFRLRGKTYDYKIQYENIKKFFLLPKTDEVHTLITIGLDPPLRQGQTRYPFIVMQCKRDDDIELELNVSEQDLQDKFKELQQSYSGPTYIVLTQLFKGLCGKKVISPSKDFSSRHAQPGVKCSIKANEGHFYCMDKSFMFVPKPATYIGHDQIHHVTFSRVGGAVSASRTFDITFTLKDGAGEQQFSNVNREEQKGLESFMHEKNIKVRNEMAEDTNGMLAAAMREQALDDSDDEGEQAARGSADEDSEEEDEDFKADSESDVAEEYNSNVEDSDGSDSDAEMSDAPEDEEPRHTESAVERPKKKLKTDK